MLESKRNKLVFNPPIYVAARFVKGDRFALGASLFSDYETLIEKLDFAKYQYEIEDTLKWQKHIVYDGIQYQTNSNDFDLKGTIGENDTWGIKKQRDSWTNPLVRKSKKPKWYK